jgi:hypothetical protein
MALPSSGQLSFSDIQAEFSRGYSMSNYTGTGYYTSGGSSGTFPSSNLSFSNFYDTQPNAPYLWGTPFAYNYGFNNTSGTIVLGINGGQPGESWSIELNFTTSGLPLGTIFSGTLDSGGNGSFTGNPTAPDGYWWPRPQTNYIAVYQSYLMLANYSFTS